MLYMYIYIHI